MAVATWPDTLPQAPLVQGYQREIEDNRLRFQTESAIPKVRPRSSHTAYLHTCSMLLTWEQLVDLHNFYRVTLNHGSGQFRLVEPTEGGEVRFMFESTIRDEFVGPKWRVTYTLRQMP